MFIKPLSYYSSSKKFLNKAWGHGKFLASKADSILRQGMEVYGAIKPIASEAAQMYGGTKAKQALPTIDRGISKASERYEGGKKQTSQGAALAERLAGAIGGY